MEFSPDFLKETYKIRLKDETTIKYSTDEERKFVEKIVKEYGSLSATQLSEITHTDEKYINTYHDEIIL
ncbi:type II toxin-antitoxin system antitoxin SocA domain-containing protein [Marinitoga sp. 1155]|uniref:type II toxin-antitoxin system antitoxin SocA domain-containing protein n=1 Tax=Marinitoga sp. 1155 TaxID=1428448 RepID=UPI00065A78C6|nr:type II toxin-antitoxin system antitoxin SocA domain-containing protein [Marinitoga sp. 1155]KLO24946.1 hypothetical protein X274_01680 [Marinitoga sp. 1155]